MFPQLFEQGCVGSQASWQIQGNVLLTRRKPDDHPIQFAATGVGKMDAAESDNAGSPHGRFFSCCLLHYADDLEAILSDWLIRDGVQEILDTCLSLLGL